MVSLVRSQSRQLRQGISLILFETRGLSGIGQPFQCGFQFLGITLPPMCAHKQTQSLNVVGVAGEQLVHQFEQLIVFAFGKHLLSDKADHANRIVDAVAPQI